MLKFTVIYLITFAAASERILSKYDYTNKKEEVARQFLQTYASFNPVAILVDSTKQSHEDASNFIRNVHKLDRNSARINFMMIKFNSSGATAVLETTQNNRKRFEDLLQKPIEPAASTYLGRENDNKTAAFFAILKATQVNPKGAIVVFINRGIEDEELAHHAAIEIEKNRLRVFVVWGGKPTGKEETVLKQFCEHSRGEFWISEDQNLSDLYYAKFLENPDTIVSSIVTRRNLLGENNLLFPVDSDITGIHISITPNITSGILTTPTGYKIDVMDSESVAQYTEGSFLKRDAAGGLHEIHFNTTTATTQDVGLWRLRVYARTTYNVAIFAHTKLTTDAFITFQNSTGLNHPGTRRKIMKLGLTGDISKIKSVTFVGIDGNPISDNVKYTFDKNFEDYSTQQEKKEIKIEIDKVPREEIYAVVNGKDSKGYDFTRMSYVSRNGESDIFPNEPLTIEIGLGSELITQPNRQPQILFEITNNHNSATLVRFYCKDERSILLAMSHNYKWINPKESTTVAVTLTTSPGSYKDFITFTAVGSTTVEKKLIVDVGGDLNDRTDPEIDYKFKSDCTEAVFESCEEGTWTVEVKAKDTGAGLLTLISRPKGLHFPNGFTAGTQEQVSGYYSNTCCNPDLQIEAVDRHNNRRVRNINAYRATLGPGAIAAIVLGVLILIALIIVLVFVIRRFCLKPESGSWDLPIYRGPTSNSRRL